MPNVINDMSPVGRHKAFLRGLNEQEIRPFLIYLETSYAAAAAGTPNPSPYTIPSDRDIFVYGIKGWMQRAISDVGQLDTERVNAQLVSVQINANPTDVNLFSTPTKLASFMSWPDGDTNYVKLPVPWRLQGGAVITASWTALAGMPAAQRFFGVLLICEAVVVANL